MVKYNFEEKNLNLQEIEDKALHDDELLNIILMGLQSKDNTIRSNCFDVMQELTKKHPQNIYSEWDYFQDMLYSKNNYHKYISIYLIANLTQSDTEKKFENIFDDYFGILASDKTMTASHVALNSSTIYYNKPQLQSKILDVLLNIDKLHNGKQKELVKAYVIEALRKIYPHSNDKARIEEFIRLQTESKSPKTRNLAVCFLENCK